jgi:NAD(P)-dependent dehydrogenase (short-subunit alcohol dehydrogenase family)
LLCCGQQSDEIAGADVAITYTSQDPASFASELSSTHSVNIKAFKCNVKSSAEIDQCVEDVTKAYGRKVDIAIANAGVSLWKQAHENTDGELRWSRVSHF